MHARKRKTHRKEHPAKAHKEPAEGERIKPRNPLVPLVRQLGHKRHGDKHGYRRHPKHKQRGWD